MSRPAFKREEVSAKAQRAAAFDIVMRGRLETLTDAKLESIVRSHVAERYRAKLLAELRATLTARIAREARGGL